MTRNNSHIPKTSGFKVPKDYFAHSDEHILNVSHLKESASDSGFEVPSDYFENFDARVLSKLEQEKEVKVISIGHWKTVIAAIAVAASLILAFNLFMSTPQPLSFDSLETAAIENYLEESDYTSYELATLLSENNLITDHFIDNNIDEDQLEAYLLDTNNLEDLITN